MKLRPEHYESMKAAVKVVLDENPDAASLFEQCGISHARFRWEILHVSKWFNGRSREVYEYVNDGNIDTALRQAFRELGAPYGTEK